MGDHIGVGRMPATGFTVPLCQSALVRWGKQRRQNVTNKAISESSPAPVLISRLVVAGPPAPQQAQALLRAGLAGFPKGQRAKVLMTPGGFIEAPWPEGLKPGPSGIVPLASLIPSAEQALRQVITPAMKRLARKKVELLTVGVDLLTPARFKAPHAELVGVYDVAKDRVLGWTGKSYPHAAQEKTLCAVDDVQTHCIEAAGERLLVLGCHDLNMFSPRAWANQGEASARRRITQAMREAAHAFRPTLVLQHPHGTDTPNIWRVAWVQVGRLFEGLKGWASGIGYFNYRDVAAGPRASLKRVLDQTCHRPGAVLDIVVRTQSSVPSGRGLSPGQ